jgi:hypothetical protein
LLIRRLRVRISLQVCAQIDEASVRQFVKMASVEHAPRFLRFLKNLMAPCGDPIKRNQKLVLDTLSEKEAALILFNDEQGRARRDELVEKRDHEVHPRGLLMYHIELIGLLGTAVVGENAAAESVVRELLPLDDLVEHLLAPNLPTTLKTNLMLVLNEAYFVTERKCRDLDECDELPLLVTALTGEIGDFVEDVLPTAAFEEDEEIEKARYVVGVVVPTLAAYYAVAGAPSGEGRTACDEVLAPQLKLLFEAGEAQPDLLQPAGVAKLLEVLNVEGAQKSAEEALAASASHALSLAQEAEAHHEAHPQEHVHAFIEEFYDEVKGADEFDGLVQVFSRGVHRTIAEQRLAAAGGKGRGAALADDKSGTRYVKSLIDQLLALSADDEDEEHHHHQDTEQTVISLQVLTAVLESGPENEHVERQLLLNSVGLATVAFKMASCDDDDLCRAGLRLSIALLDGGNTKVQESFLTLLQDPDAEHLHSADGTEGSFLAKTKTRLRLGFKEIKDRKIYLAQQQDRRADFEEATAGLSAVAREAMREDVERPYPSRAFVVSTLEMLRLLCEGHHEPLQDFLRAQPSQIVTHDLVKEAYELLVALEARLRPLAPHEPSRVSHFRSPASTASPCFAARDRRDQRRPGAEVHRHADGVCAGQHLERQQQAAAADQVRVAARPNPE